MEIFNENQINRLPLVFWNNDNVQQQLPVFDIKIVGNWNFMKGQMSYQTAQKLHALAHAFQQIPFSLFFTEIYVHIRLMVFGYASIFRWHSNCQPGEFWPSNWWVLSSKNILMAKLFTSFHLTTTEMLIYLIAFNFIGMSCVCYASSFDTYYTYAICIFSLTIQRKMGESNGTAIFNVATINKIAWTEIFK